MKTPPQPQPSLILGAEHKMAPATKQRRAASSARPRADSDSDAEYQVYNSRLKEASAARTRLRKVQSPPLKSFKPTMMNSPPNPGPTNP